MLLRREAVVAILAGVCAVCWPGSALAHGADLFVQAAKLTAGRGPSTSAIPPSSDSTDQFGTSVGGVGERPRSGRGGTEGRAHIRVRAPCERPLEGCPPDHRADRLHEQRQSRDVGGGVGRRVDDRRRRAVRERRGGGGVRLCGATRRLEGRVGAADEHAARGRQHRKRRARRVGGNLGTRRDDRRGRARLEQRAGSDLPVQARSERLGPYQPARGRVGQRRRSRRQLGLRRSCSGGAWRCPPTPTRSWSGRRTRTAGKAACTSSSVPTADISVTASCATSPRARRTASSCVHPARDTGSAIPSWATRSGSPRNGETIAAGEPCAGRGGQAVVYTERHGDWLHRSSNITAGLTPRAPNAAYTQQFGFSVAVSGDGRTVIGSDPALNNGYGAFVAWFREPRNGWSHVNPPVAVELRDGIRSDRVSLRRSGPRDRRPDRDRLDRRHDLRRRRRREEQGRRVRVQRDRRPGRRRHSSRASPPRWPSARSRPAR